MAAKYNSSCSHPENWSIKTEVRTTPAVMLGSTRRSQEMYFHYQPNKVSAWVNWRNTCFFFPFCECEVGPGGHSTSPRQLPAAAPCTSNKHRCSHPQKRQAFSPCTSARSVYLFLTKITKKKQHRARIYMMPWYTSCLHRAALLIKRDCLL